MPKYRVAHSCQGERLDARVLRPAAKDSLTATTSKDNFVLSDFPQHKGRIFNFNCLLPVNDLPCLKNITLEIFDYCLE